MLYKDRKIATSGSRQKGAVWVEFLIASSTILVSLFILIPILAKYMDLRHKTEQSANYSVWESSVWHAGEGKAQEKSKARLLGEAQQRVLAEGDTLVYTGQENDDLKVDSLHYFSDALANSQSYKTLLGARGATASSAMSIGTYNETNQPKIDEVKTLVASSKATAFTKLGQYKGSTLGFITGVNTSDTTKVMNQKGYYTVDGLSLSVKSPSWMPAFSSIGDTLTMTTSKSLLVDSWGAGGLENTRKKVNKLQPKRLMRHAAKAYQTLFTNPIVSLLNISDDLDMMDYDDDWSDFYINSDELLDKDHQLGQYYK